MRRLWAIIPQNYRRRTIWVAGTIFLRALLNFIGVATLIPILGLILQHETVMSNEYIAGISKVLNIDNYNTLGSPA